MAHSLGGVVVSEAAQRRPELFDALVYISAMTPVAGLTASAYNGVPETAGSLLPSFLAADPSVVGAVRADFDSPQVRDLARRAFYHDAPAAVADNAISLLCADAALGVDGAVSASSDRLGAIPRRWVLCTEDRILPEAVQKRLIAELDNMVTNTLLPARQSSTSRLQLHEQQQLLSSLTV